MPFTTVAFFKDGANSTLDAIQPVADEHVTVSGNDLTVPELNHIVYVAASGVDASRVQLQAPSLRRLWLEDIGEMGNGGLLGAVNHIGVDYREDPLPLEVSEKLNVYTIHTSDMYVMINLADGAISPVHGDIRTIKATTTLALKEGQWVHGTLSFAQTLPAGRYQVVGFRAVGTGGRYQVVGFRAVGTGVMAARLVFVGYTWRPGVPGVSSLVEPGDEIFRRGKFGVFGEFEFDQPPSIDILGDRDEASATEKEFYLDLIQIRAGR